MEFYVHELRGLGQHLLYEYTRPEFSAVIGIRIVVYCLMITYSLVRGYQLCENTMSGKYGVASHTENIVTRKQAQTKTEYKYIKMHSNTTLC